MGIGGVISSLLSLGGQLIPAVSASLLSPSSPPLECDQIEVELKQLMRLLERIKATLYDAEEREIRDLSVKLWLKELEGVAYHAEDVLDEYHYEILRAQVEATDGRQVPDGMLYQIKQIRSKFSEIEKDRLALRLTDEDGPRRCNSDLQIAPTSHFVLESEIIGREMEKEQLIDILSSESDDGKIVSVVTIVGTGGIGKTTLAQLLYNDQRMQPKFDKFGWVCVSEDFNVQRLTREAVESITGEPYRVINLSALQAKIGKEIGGQRVFLVLDDVWNENRNQWELFQRPFESASLVKILVTTRSERVAQIMQTVPTFTLGYMPEKQSWQLFQHYAFGKLIQKRDSNFIEIGKAIIKKCGMLPLAIKSIASLLRHEKNEESWRGILENELWKTDANNEIFWPLQISYARLPTYLKPCFLYCSMFPRDYRYSTRELVRLWIYQGYVHTDGLKNAEQIGWEYVKQLWQRSFFEGKYNEKEFSFQLHDMVHDLARFNSGHGYYFIEGDMVPNFPDELHHLYVCKKELVQPLPFLSLRTLLVRNHWGKRLPSGFHFSEAQKLRALELEFNGYPQSHISFVNLKHLRYLSLNNGRFEKLPKSICFLYNLQNLTLLNCCHLSELPQNIGNLVSLEELIICGSLRLQMFPVSLWNLKALRKLNLTSLKLEELPLDIGNLVNLEELIIRQCFNLRMLPMSLCLLKVLRMLCLCKCFKLEELPPNMGDHTNLQLLRIEETKLSSLPPRLKKNTRTIEVIDQRHGRMKGWLEYFVDFGGTLVLSGLSCVRNFENFYRANLASMKHLHCLILTWLDGIKIDECYGNVIHLCINSDSNANSVEDFDDQSRSLMIYLQPHPNLKELQMEGYPGLEFSSWIRNPSLCASLEQIKLIDYNYIASLPFGGLYNLKYLKLDSCFNMKVIREGSLPLVLEVIDIWNCKNLTCVPGIQGLCFLVKFDIVDCMQLHWLGPTRCTPSVRNCPKLGRSERCIDCLPQPSHCRVVNPYPEDQYVCPVCLTNPNAMAFGCGHQIPVRKHTQLIPQRLNTIKRIAGKTKGLNSGRYGRYCGCRW
ncbi:Disease resistance protein (CC-NBS-LRR class) family [Rhynchospora pubera]|uniref:Disease resistance protein (CC-NBS-LRR class) family n=1 Tax=Rhynchospora pubera TaxID=906938 RepID=A0AAV8E8S3_9POAL|nr:Disease resistance protein (CC-NBS-LRR class) family [Rhynchospora pubera]